ncbi:MAG: hypothetical protein Q7J73_07090 [Dehalococcoidales bacterium]|nr:hypothetical protein [Dehalococcoidales bacterium]
MACPHRQMFPGILSNIAMAAILLFVAFSPFACSNSSINAKPAAKSSELLDSIRQNDRISVSLNALMTFNDHGKNVTATREFSVKDVPLLWGDTSLNNTTFSGNIYNADRHIIDSVHGVVTEDGKWLEHVTFWREIKEGATDSTFEITLYAVPLIDITGGNVTRVGICEKTGDVRKHVLKIDYLPEGIVYVPTNWENGAQPPVMKVRFDKESPN